MFDITDVLVVYVRSSVHHNFNDTVSCHVVFHPRFIVILVFLHY